MPRTRALLALALGLAMCSTATACVFLYGLAPDHALQPGEDTTVHWSHGFAGDDWTDPSWSCAAGQKQSPISVKTRDYSYQRLPSKALHTQWHYGTFTSNGSNIEIWNSGHTIQVQWPGVTWPSVTTSIAVPADADNTTTVTAVLGITSRTPNVKRVRMTPLQFHFHARSEHTVDGMYFPLELHIVHSIAQADVPGCPASGCLSVTGILVRLVDDSVGDNPLLEDILDAASDIRGSKTHLPAGKTINIDRFITKYDGYVTYEGSLTTPPCTEGLLWHVLMRNMYITTRQLQRYHLLIAAKNCENAPETSHEGRRLHGHAHSHAHAHAHAHSHSHDEDDHAHEDALFPTRRQLLLDELPEEVAQGPYNCTAAGYGQNYRMPQELRGRIVKKSF